MKHAPKYAITFIWKFVSVPMLETQGLLPVGNEFEDFDALRAAQDGHYDVFASVRGWLDIANASSGGALNADVEYQSPLSEITHPEIGVLIEFIKSVQRGLPRVF
jgi:hypothetical protein